MTTRFEQYDQRYFYDEYSQRHINKQNCYKCKYHQLCYGYVPKYHFSSKTKLCYYCTNKFDNADEYNPVFKMKANCSNCSKFGRVVNQPKCKHFLCLECSRKCYFGTETYLEEPVFPYPDMEHDYFSDMENPYWKKKYPLIKSFEERWNRWDAFTNRSSNIRRLSKKCPTCHK